MSRFRDDLSSVMLNFAKHKSGASAVEFALIVPVLLLVLLSIVQFGIVLNNYVELSAATRASARQFALARGSATPVTNAKSAVKFSAPNISPTLSFSVNGAACATDALCATALNTASGLTSSVTATYSCASLLSVMGYKFAPNCNLTSTTTELVE
jgi:Flp pilus assembly protein TadG